MVLEKTAVILVLSLQVACYDSSHGSAHLRDADGDTQVPDADADADLQVDGPSDPFPDDVVPDYSGLDSFWDNGPDLDPECPPPSDIETSFVIDGIEAPSSAVDLLAPCAVEGLDMPVPDAFTLTLACTEDSGPVTHTIEVASFPPLHLELALDSDVMFQYRVAPSSGAQTWTNRWFVIYAMDGGLLFAGSDADVPWPPDEEGTAWFSPLTPYIHDNSCTGGAQECFAYERLSMAFEWSTGQYVGIYVYDRGEAWLGYGAAYHIRLGEATRRTAIVCPEEPPTWYSLLITFDPNG